ncbi:heavy-metal-associated domain-containing protein [Pseudomonas aegrilactucae]|uniref:Cation transporter n=1 Tax=Pseudomonas aegrilactucae TaxID=2854028 RepID=A0A9Q2XPA4_9PSED|nr:cation transporter [Pseudomonas aegrilactucae]MBV6289736.1 cation transporter [Pseudomonas aegrilactucae]
MQVFSVQGMTCGHCVKAVTRAVQSQDEGAVVEVDLGAKQVRVQSSLQAPQILQAIREEGYQAELLA